MGVLPHSIFNLFFLYFDSTRVGDAVVKIIAYISQSPCMWYLSSLLVTTLLVVKLCVGENDDFDQWNWSSIGQFWVVLFEVYTTPGKFITNQEMH